MLLQKTRHQVLRILKRNFNRSKPIVKLNEEVSESIDKEVYKPRRHPGRMKPYHVTLPDKIIQSIEVTCEEYPIKTLMQESIPFQRYLKGRLLPVEKHDLRDIRRQIYEDVISKTEETQKSKPLDDERLHQSIKDQIHRKLKENIYNWTPINYNLYNSLLYLFARFPADYAVLVRIFSEINLRNPDFKPRSFFDFGSGTGSASWAAKNFWKKNIFEYFNVDSSADMNDLALLLLKDGKGAKEINLNGIFYRQFLPSSNVTYDLVVSAYSLLELPSLKTRLQTILNLWNKTTKYLVIVEQGTNAGFKIINEVRDFILNIETEGNQGHVFSPCPHDLICPRFLTDDTPCNFHVYYNTFPFSGPISIKRELYSYVILEKGKRRESDLQWPRLVRSPLVRSQHTVCRLCTHKGALEEVIFTRGKHGKIIHHCARSSEWGDLLPMKLEENLKSENNPSEDGTDHENKD